jgi:hypothetical protein
MLKKWIKGAISKKEIQSAMLRPQERWDKLQCPCLATADKVM